LRRVGPGAGSEHRAARAGARQEAAGANLERGATSRAGLVGQSAARRAAPDAVQPAVAGAAVFVRRIKGAAADAANETAARWPASLKL
jgi:hypothetical protein